MVQKYLQKRGNTFYFRWKLPQDLCSFFGVTEFKSSLRTPKASEAVLQAARLLLVVETILEARRAYIASRIELDDYKRQLFLHRRGLHAVTRKKGKYITDLKSIICSLSEGLKIDFNGDHDKELEAAKELIPLLASDGLKPLKSSTIIDCQELYDQFLAHKINKEGLSDRIQKEYERYFKTLNEINPVFRGSVSAVTKKDIREALLTYLSLPKRNKRDYKFLSVAELLEIDVPGKDRLAPKTVTEVKKFLQGLFAFAVSQDLVSESPARDLKIDLKSNATYGSYSNEEVNRILSVSRSEAEPWKRWMPMLAAYTGARRGELAQLRKQDIKKDSDSERYYILITEEAGSVKTESGTRQVPIHQKLIDAGFLEFSSSSTARLFEDLNPQAVTRWFSSLQDKLEIERFDDYGNRKVFHSFRHTFITKARGAGCPVYHVQQVVGHEKTSVGVTDKYTHRQPLGAVLDVVDCIDYSG